MSVHYPNAIEGVWGHSSAGGQKEYVIFCVGQEPRMVSAFRAWAAAQGISFKSLKGCYKGKPEDSFLVAAEDFPSVRHWTTREETVLHLGPANARDMCPATLLYQDGGRQPLGLFRSCSRTAAFSRSSWTYDPSQDIYFIAE